MSQSTAVAALAVAPERSGGVHFGALDGYRALAAYAVLTTHVAFTTGASVSSGPGRLLSRLDIGVTIFFVLSGFLLYRPWALAAMRGSSGPRTSRYAVRRAARVLPAYWLVVVATLLVLPELRPVPGSVWWQHLLLLHTYLGPGPVEGLTQTWSLGTEVAFYVALPVIAYLAGRRGRGRPDASTRAQLGVIAALVVLSWAWTVLRATSGLSGSAHAGYWLVGYLDWFGAGMALAVLSARTTLPGPGRAVRTAARLGADTWTALVAALAIFLLLSTPVAGSYTLEPLSAWATVVKHVGYGTVAALLLAPGVLAAGTVWHRALTHPVVAYLGRISYGVFLWHLLLLRLLLPVLGIDLFQGGFWLLWVATAATATGAAALSYRLVEAPVQRLAHRRTAG